ncbi:MAG TPA: septal ring lytic transglycosylase RlpA family protein [Polyangiaceae bacterium]|nr:septal ring lytic transglycosylase RlpA family protein [Polyangiaceae bacterium]
MFALRRVAPLWAVLVVACASEPPRADVPPPRDKGSRSSATETGPASTSAPPLAHAASQDVEESPDTLSQRYARSPALARFSGQVSYYSDALAGRSTASGEPYQPRAFTAAHRSLPFGTIVRVTSDVTGKSVYVRINDRGPFVRGRVLDLSRAAAERLGLLGRGVLKVRAEIVENGPTKPRARRRTRKRKSSH